jgi:hypothetical protein
VSEKVSAGYQEAVEAAEKILELTDTLWLTGDPENVEREVDNYSAMIDEREPLIKKLTELLKNDFSSGERVTINKIISGIIESDKKLASSLDKINNSVKTSIKDIRRGKKINFGYSGLTENESSGLLDAKQ